MAVSDPATDVPTPTGTLQGVAAYGWDGSAWQPAGRASVGVGTPTGVLRGVAQFPWSGSAWQPPAQAGPSVATPSGVLDGVAVYTWSGSAWVPAGGTTTPSTPSGSLRGVAAFTWDGTAWQPAAQAGPSVATPYGVLEGVALFNWTGAAWAAVGAPSLDLSFMTPGTLDPRLTFTRASVGTYFDVTGTMQTATANTPRWDYNPTTHVLNGLLVEEARTNLLLNSATLNTQSVAVTAQAYTLSFYGTGTITLSGVSTAGPLTGTGAFPQRVSLTFTPTAGTLTCTVTGSVLNAQLEAGAIVTSYIPTPGVAVARAAEVVSMATGVWFVAGPSSQAADFMLAQTPNPSALHRDVCGLSDGTTNMRLALRAQFLSANLASVGAVTSGAAAFSTTLGIPAANAVSKMAGSWNATVATGSLNAGAAVTVTVGVPTGINLLTVGNDGPGSTTYLNGWVRRVRYWPRALSNAELQAATT